MDTLTHTAKRALLFSYRCTKFFFCVGVRGQYIRYAPTKHGRAVVWPFSNIAAQRRRLLLAGLKNFLLYFILSPAAPGLGLDRSSEGKN